MKPDLSLVMPAYNEQVRLPGALARLAAFGHESGLAIEVIVSDDGSDDETAIIAGEWEKKKEVGFAVHLIEIRHRGKGAAVRAGMALPAAPIVGFCDVDLSAGPDAILQVYNVIKDGADMAMGSRGLVGSVLEVRQPWYRERARRIFNLVLRKLARVPHRDTQCGLKLFRADVAKEIFRHQRLDGFAFDAEIVVLALRLGFSVEEVAIRWAHAEGSKVSMIRDSVRMSRDILGIVRRLGRGEVHAPGIPSRAALDMMTTSEDRHWWHVTKRQLVSGILSEVGSDKRCLDVGCGGGAMVAAASKIMPSYGMDLSEHALAHARSRGLTRLVLAEGGGLPFGGSSFGAVLALDVIEHHPRPEDLLADSLRILEPGGKLIVTVPAFQWMWSYADHVLGHFRRYSKGQLAGDLMAAGFELERVTYFYSWLLPIAWVFRKVRSIAKRSNRLETGDDFEVPGPLNSFLLWVSNRELKYLKSHDLPFGLSLLAIAHRPSTLT